MSDEFSRLEEELADADGDSPSIRRMTETEFLEAAVLWRSGRYTVEEIADKFQVRPRSLERRFTRNNVVRGSEAQLYVEAAEKVVRSKAEISAERVEETREQHYAWSTAIAKMVMNEIVLAQKTEKPMAMIEDNLKAYGHAIKVLQTARNERWAILGLDKDGVADGDLPELMVSVFTEEQLAAIKTQLQGADVDVEDLDMADPPELEALS